MTKHHAVRAVALGVLTVILVACAATPGSSAVADPATPAPPDGTAVAPGIDPSIEDAMAFRAEMGLRADLAWVQAVAANPEAVSLDWGVPLLPFEVADLERRQTGEGDIAQAVQAYLAEHAVESGGLYIDQARGGILTVLVTGDPAVHEAAIRQTIGDAPLAVRQVRWSEAELNQLQERLFQDRAFFDSIPAFLSTSSTDVIANQVVIDISSAAPDAGARIAARFGAEEGQLRVVSDGSGILLLPVGRIEGRIIAPAGTDVTTLSPQYEPDVPIGPRDAVGIAVAPNGTFTIDDLPPTGYRVYLLEAEANGNREAGEVHVIVPPGGVAIAEVTYEAP